MESFLDFKSSLSQPSQQLFKVLCSENLSRIDKIEQICANAALQLNSILDPKAEKSFTGEGTLMISATQVNCQMESLAKAWSNAKLIDYWVSSRADWSRMSLP
jgi:hypothetical protein